MGARGPLPNPNSRRSQAKSRQNSSDVVTSGQLSHLNVAPPTIPSAPARLTAGSKRLWSEFWACQWAQDSDLSSITLLCRLEDERARILRAIGSDLTLERPIVSPKGNVVGTELVAHPLLRDLRRLDPVIVQLRDRLGLTPAARGRLGQPVVVKKTTDGREAAVERMMAGYRSALGGAG